MSAPVVSRGHIFLLVGPSGGGKTTLIHRVTARGPAAGSGASPGIPAFTFVPSTTSRPPRPGEQDGVDYHFVGEADFEGLAAHGDFLEWQRVHGFRYGSSRARLLAAVADGHWGITTADILGAFKIKAALPEAVSTVFVTPSDSGRLRERILERSPLSEAEVGRRLGRVAMEMELAHACDRLILNDEIEDAVARLEVCVAAQVEEAARLAHFAERPVVRMVHVGPPPRPECGTLFCVAGCETPRRAAARVLHQWWWECHPKASSFALPPWRVEPTGRQEYRTQDRVTLDITWWNATCADGRPFAQAVADGGEPGEEQGGPAHREYL